MSRSKKKTKKRAITTATSEKEDKRLANRKIRRKNKTKSKLRDEEYHLKKELSNVWSFSKDGKIYDKEMSDKELRK